MSKLAQVVVGETGSDKLKEAQFDSDESYLKKKKEDEKWSEIHILPRKRKMKS